MEFRICPHIIWCLAHGGPWGFTHKTLNISNCLLWLPMGFSCFLSLLNIAWILILLTCIYWPSSMSKMSVDNTCLTTACWNLEACRGEAESALHDWEAAVNEALWTQQASWSSLEERETLNDLEQLCPLKILEAAIQDLKWKLFTCFSFWKIPREVHTKSHSIWIARVPGINQAAVSCHVCMILGVSVSNSESGKLEWCI